MIKQSSNQPIVVMALYKFVPFADFEAFQQPLNDAMHELGVKGSLLIASEGINGTVAGDRKGVDGLRDFLNARPELTGFGYKESYTDEQPFYRSKVKLKKEIVTMGVEGVDPLDVVGSYVKPKDWNALISDPDVVLVDTRNDYEVGVGTFKGALDPNTTSFREFPQYVKDNLDPEKNKKVAMYCTGGIRCEKSTAYLKSQGFDEVYHLEGGILKYLEEVDEKDSMWEGECFVFDNRVTVNHQLEKGEYDQCHGCRHPILEKDKESPLYEVGVCCHLCHGSLSDIQRERFTERQKQIRLAKERGHDHIGGDIEALHEENRQRKQEFKAQQQAQSLKKK